MALNAGDSGATSGLSKAIYDEIESNVLENMDGWNEGDPNKLTDDAQEEIEDNWKQISYAIANGLIEHFKTNAEVVGVSTTLAVASVSGVTTGPGVSGPGTGTGTQNNSGTII